MNIIDKLMQIDPNKVKKNTGVKKLYLSRIGSEFEFECVELDTELATELSEESLNLKASGDIELKTFNLKVKTVLYGCPNVFSNQSLLDHFNCVDPIDLIKKILTKDELEALSDYINELGSVKSQKDTVEEIKN